MRTMSKSCLSRLLTLNGSRVKFTRCVSQSTQFRQFASSSTQPIQVPEKTIVNPLEHEDFFNIKELFSLRDLFMSRVHMGHTSGVRNPYMIPYIFGNRLGADVIDLDQTIPLLRDALNVIAHIAYRGGVILFLSRNVQTMPIIEKAAEDVGEYTHCRKWKLGTFTNSATYYGSMVRLPDLCIFINTLDTVFEEHPAVIEAAKMNIPSVGIVDTNCDPRLISYPVPGNDDTPIAIQFYCNMFKAAIQRGKEKRLGGEKEETTEKKD